MTPFVGCAELAVTVCSTNKFVAPLQTPTFGQLTGGGFGLFGVIARTGEWARLDVA